MLNHQVTFPDNLMPVTMAIKQALEKRGTAVSLSRPIQNVTKYDKFWGY
jgi:hypothetical protein